MDFMEKLQERIDTVYYELVECEEKLRDDDLDDYEETEARASRLDGRLQELNWVKQQLTK